MSVPDALKLRHGGRVWQFDKWTIGIPPLLIKCGWGLGIYTGCTSRSFGAVIWLGPFRLGVWGERDG